MQVTDDEVLDSEDQLKQRWDDAASNEPKKNALTLDTAGLATVENDPVWAESIQVSGESRLSELIARWGNSDWVNQGRAYAHDAECPFCQQALPGDFHAELAKLLDGDRQTKIDDLTDKVATYRDYSKFKVPEMAKHFGYAYQKEVRVAFRPRRKILTNLEPLFLSIGSMTDYADLVPIQSA